MISPQVDDKKIQERDTFLTQLNDIVFENNEVGEFELGNVKINVKSLNSFEQELIFIPK